MADRRVWGVGDLNPSITDTADIAGVPQNLTGKTARFKMRAVNSSTLKVNQPVSNTLDTTGVLRYDWTGTDTDTAGEYLVWWEITTSGKVQQIGEAVIEIRAHAPLSNGYYELEEFKETFSLQGTTYADGDIQEAIVAASRTIDLECDRRFYPDTDALQVRVYNPLSRSLVRIDDLITLTSFKTDPGGDGTYEETWAATDYVLGPQNAVANGRPYEFVEMHPAGDYSFTGSYPNTVQVTGKFGWATAPASIRLATGMLASRFVKRMREAPFGVAGIGPDGGAVRVSAIDPDIQRLIQPYSRKRLLV